MVIVNVDLDVRSRSQERETLFISESNTESLAIKTSGVFWNSVILAPIRALPQSGRHDSSRARRVPYVYAFKCYNADLAALVGGSHQSRRWKSPKVIGKARRTTDWKARPTNK